MKAKHIASTLVILVLAVSCTKSDYKNQIEKNLNSLAKNGSWEITSGWYYLFDGSIESGYIEDSVNYEFCTTGKVRVSDTNMVYSFVGVQGNYDISYSGKVIYVQFEEVLTDINGNSPVSPQSRLVLVNTKDPNGSSIWGVEDFIRIVDGPNNMVFSDYYTVDVRKIKKDKYMMSLNKSYTSGGVKDEMVIQLTK